jgi:hypothetical protein
MTHRLGSARDPAAATWQLKRHGLSRLAGLLCWRWAQISLGISNVVFHLPLLVAVAHNLGGAALLLTLVLIIIGCAPAGIPAADAHGLLRCRANNKNNRGETVWLPAREHQDHASWRDYLADQAAGGGADADHHWSACFGHPRGVPVLIFGNLGIGSAPVRRRRQPCGGSAHRFDHGPHPQASRNLGSHLAQCCLRLCSAAGRDWDGTAADLTNELAAWLTLASLLGYAVIYTGFSNAPHRRTS